MADTLHYLFLILGAQWDAPTSKPLSPPSVGCFGSFDVESCPRLSIGAEQSKVLYQGVDVLICEALLPRRHVRAQSGPSAALLDDFENVVIRQLLHLIAIGKISRPFGENGPNWAIAAAGLAVTGGAVGVENLSGWIIIRSTRPARHRGDPGQGRHEDY
jgi:hypothetical protein